MVLPAEKEKCIVVLNKVNYMAKCQKHLNDKKTYEKLKRDPTKKYKDQLFATLLDLKESKAIDYTTWDNIYPTTESPPKLYGLPKIHKKDMLVRPMVSSTVSIMSYVPNISPGS